MPSSSSTTLSRPPLASVTTEPGWLRVTLTIVVLLLMTAFVFAPLVEVFGQALAQGLGAAIASLNEPDAWSALRLTLIVAVWPRILPDTTETAPNSPMARALQSRTP